MDMIVNRNVEAVMRDGTVLRADIFRPADDQRHPVLLARTPYGKSVLFHFDLLNPFTAVERGYVVVLQDTRGCFASDGEWIPWKYETDDGYDTVAWVARQDFCDGIVGMWGSSYLGNTQWRAAISGAPALQAIAPSFTFATPLDGLYLRGGVPEHGLNVAWSLQTAVANLSRSGNGDAMIEAIRTYDLLPEGGYADEEPGRIALLEAENVPDLGLRRYLRDPETSLESEVASLLDDVSLPALHFGGWYDTFLQGTLDTFRRQISLGINSQLVVGPWTHADSLAALSGERYFGTAAGGPTIELTKSHDALQLDFFDEHLRGTKPLETPARVRLFVMGINEWRQEHEWPLSRAVPTPLYLGPQNGLRAAPDYGSGEDSFEYDLDNPVPTIGGNVLMHEADRAGAFNQSGIEDRSDLLVYTSAVLEEDLEITGEVTVSLFANTTASEADWVVRLCDVFPDGNSINLVDGIIRASGDEPVHTLSLWSTSNVFLRGHRLRVHVTSGSFPRWGKNLKMSSGAGASLPRQTIRWGSQNPSRIVLPVVSGSLPA